jgi:glycine cleavage system aminomethyltransferase T
VLNHVLKQPGMAATAVIVNEFGEIGLDHLLVERSSEDVVLLTTAAVCAARRARRAAQCPRLSDKPRFRSAMGMATGSLTLGATAARRCASASAAGKVGDTRVIDPQPMQDPQLIA